MSKGKHKKFNFIHSLESASKPVGKLINAPFKSFDHAIDKGAGVLNNYSLPLIIGGGVLAYFVLTKR